MDVSCWAKVFGLTFEYVCIIIDILIREARMEYDRRKEMCIHNMTMNVMLALDGADQSNYQLVRVSRNLCKVFC